MRMVTLPALRVVLLTVDDALQSIVYSMPTKYGVLSTCCVTGS